MKYVAPVRRELGLPTTFNLIGPLTNPAGARHQLIGVADARYVDRLAEAVRLMGSERNLIVHAEDGLDELSTTCPTAVVEVFAGQGFDRRYAVDAAEFGLARAQTADLLGGERRRERRHRAPGARRRTGAEARHRASERRRRPVHRRGGAEHRRGHRGGARGRRRRSGRHQARRPDRRLAPPEGRGGSMNGAQGGGASPMGAGAV